MPLHQKSCALLEQNTPNASQQVKLSLQIKVVFFKVFNINTNNKIISQLSMFEKLEDTLRLMVFAYQNECCITLDIQF